MRIYLYIILLLLITPMIIAAEEKFVSTNVTIILQGNNLTVKTPSILEPKEFKYYNINKNTTLNQQFSYIIKTSLECTTNELANLTKSLILTCDKVQDYTATCGSIFSTNTQLSTDIIELKNKVDGQQNCQASLQTCQTSLSTTTNANNQTNTQRNLTWFAVGVGAALLGQYIFRRRFGREGPGFQRGPAPMGGR